MESLPPIRPEQVPKEDAQAHQELIALEQQKLDANKQEHHRREKLRGVFACGVRALLVLVFALVGFALLVVAWHYLGPSHLHWMAADNLKTVSTVLFSGTLFAFLGLYVRDRV